MKVLMISHTYVVETNQQKLDALAFFSDIDLSLITPTEWKHPLKTYPLEKRYDDNYNIISTKTIFNGRNYLYFYRSLSKFIRQIKPDIIHIEEESWALSTFQAICLRKISNSKTLFFTWQNIYHDYKFPYSFFEKYTLKHADYAIAGNQDAKDLLVRKGFKNPIKVLPQLGVDPELFKRRDYPRLSEELGLNDFVIGFIGRIVKEKGILTLIKAVSKLKYDYTLLLVGQGPLKPTIIEQARKQGIENKMVFVDTVPHHKVSQYLNCLDALVLPSLTPPYYKEQFGHVLIEAMSCEVPVIGSTSGEIPNVIGDAGLVFEGGDAEQLADKLSLLIEDEKYRSELARKGRERVINNYMWEKIAEETYKVYQELIC